MEFHHVVSITKIYCVEFRHANIEQMKIRRTYVSDLVNIVSLSGTSMVGGGGGKLEICHSKLPENAFVSTRTAKNVS